MQYSISTHIETHPAISSHSSVIVHHILNKPSIFAVCLELQNSIEDSPSTLQATCKMDEPCLTWWAHQQRIRSVIYMPFTIHTAHLIALQSCFLRGAVLSLPCFTPLFCPSCTFQPVVLHCKVRFLE